MSWLQELLTQTTLEDYPRDTTYSGMNGNLSLAAKEFIATGAPLGNQRDVACAIARSLLSDSHLSVDDAAAAVWQGLEASPWDPTKLPWTFNDAHGLVASIAAAPPKPRKPLAQAKIVVGGFGRNRDAREWADEPHDAAVDDPNDVEWAIPIPLFDPQLPAFPADELPVWVRDFCAAEAEATQTPVDLSCMLCLAAIATAMAKVAEVEVRPGWVEPLNIYTIVVMPSGARKSPNVRDAIEPLIRHEQFLTQSTGPKISEVKTRKAILEKELQRKQNAAAKEPDINEQEGVVRDAIDIQRKIDELKIPTPPRLLADDATPERLTGLMGENGGRISVLSSEAEILALVAGKYQGGTPNLNVFLKAFSGDHLRVDRVGREPDYIRRPAITLGVTTQPSVLEGLTATPGFRGQGFIARLLFSIPEPTVGKRDSRAMPMSDMVRDAYHDGLAALVALPHVRDEDGEWIPQIIRLTDDAHESITEFAEAIEPMLAPAASLAHMADWASKLTGAVVRIAGLIHCAETTSQGSAVMPWDTPIGSETIHRARTIGEYLLRHAMIAFAQMGADDNLRDADLVLAWIKRNGNGDVTRRDIFQGLKGRAQFQHVAALEPALQELTERGYIRRHIEPRAVGRPSEVYDVNPAIWEGRSKCQL